MFSSTGTPLSLWNKFHLGAASVFFATLAYFSFFLFSLSVPVENRTQRKTFRNIIYRGCGITIALALGVAGALARSSIHLLFLWEAIAVWAFSFSWLVKGGVLFKDP